MKVEAQDFGAFLVTCRRSWAVRVVQGLIAVVPAMAAGWLVWLAIMCLWNGSATGAVPCMIGVTVLVLLSWFLTLHIFVTLDFYERGMKWRSLLRSGEVAFEGATRLKFKVTKAEEHGLFAGSVAEFSIYPAEGKRFRWVGGYKADVSDITFAITGMGVRSEDPLTVARDIMAMHVANTLERELCEGKDVEWVSGARLSANGVTWKRGELSTWERIQTVRVNDHWCVVECDDGRQHKLNCAGRNFYPGLWVVLRRKRELVSEGKRLG